MTQELNLSQYADAIGTAYETVRATEPPASSVAAERLVDLLGPQGITLDPQTLAATAQDIADQQPWAG